MKAEKVGLPLRLMWALVANVGRRMWLSMGGMPALVMTLGFNESS